MKTDGILDFCTINSTHSYSPGVLVVTILASGSEIRRFKPSWGQWIFSECKNLSMASFGRGVKPWVPCRTFTARKRTSNEIRASEQNLSTFHAQLRK